MTPSHDTTESRARISPGKRFVFATVLLLASGLIAAAIAELALRVIPIPGITYHTFYYDSITGGKHYPHTTYIYRSARGDVVRRRINAWGFPDVEHDMTPAPRTLRIGIFGDSYTQAIQVPIEQTFSRLAEADLNTRPEAFHGLRNTRGEAIERVETLAFGMSGRSTLQSYLECNQWMSRTGLDVVVYVFVENDPGDNLRAIKRADISPYAELSGDSFVVDNTFDQKYSYKAGRLHRTFQFIKSNSLVVSTFEGRLKLLLQYGVKTRATEADFEGDVGPGGRPGQAPSSWQSDSLVIYGWELTSHIIDRWRRDVEAQGRQFMIVRVPRRAMVLTPLKDQDAWAPRLHAHCTAEDIRLIDPSPIIAPRQAAGDEVFYDHFTALGHRLFADAIVGHFLEAWKEAP